jgi:perosamine synthetase
MSQLAILGGKPVIAAPLAPFWKIGAEEEKAVVDVIRHGELSGFIGAPGPNFDGGAQVQKLEAAWSRRFGVKHSVSVNSATSGLYAALGAVGVGPGDEVIVPPYTMSATVMAPLVYGAVPVFADIEADTFCIDVDRVREAITPRTRAIMAVNLFGHAAKVHELRKLSDQHGIVLIEDNAQSPLATEFGKFAGTIGHIGVFSLNRHKHIQTGEGGVCTTDDDALALRLRLVRNHGENLVEHYGIDHGTNLIGFNYRLTELSAAVALCQLDKAEDIVTERERFALRMTAGLSDLPGLTPPVVRDDCRHVFIVWAARFDPDVIGVSRDVFCRALAAEGVPISQGYVKPLYHLPIFQQQRNDRPSYPKGLCPVCEDMHFRTELAFGICSYQLSDEVVDKVVEGFRKVYDNRHELRRVETAT